MTSSIVALILLALNLWLFFRRGWEDSYYPVHYSTIYYPKELPVVRRWKEVAQEKLEAELSWNVPVSGWEIAIDDEKQGRVAGRNPVFSLPIGEYKFHRYTATPLPRGAGPALEFNIRFLPSSIPAASGLTDPARYIIRTEQPIGRFKQLPVRHWVDDYRYLPKKHLDETDRLLREEAGIAESDDVFQKLEKLMIFYRGAVGAECRGTPIDAFRWMNPFELYQAMKSGQSKGWCTQHAQIFTFFANRAGLSARLIQGARTQENKFVFTGHTWLEAWIPEQLRWAWVEPSYGIVSVRNKHGLVLNTVELSNLREHDAFDGVTARVTADWGNPWPDAEPGTVVDQPFLECDDVVFRQFIPASVFKWRQPPNVEDIRSDYRMLFKNRTFGLANLVRYLFKPPLALARYPSEGRRTYWIRHALFWSFWAALAAAVFV